jgi:AcrR family transcriptional regulator
MRTDEKILLKAIELYNAKGFANISSRDIAKELGISHGNLEYHYKNKEVILTAIYARMKEEVSGYFSELSETENVFEHFDSFLKKLEHFQNKYLFFNLDFLEIGRQFPKLRAKVENTIQIRKDEMAKFFETFSELGYLQKEPSTGFYFRLQHKIRILITFWVSQEVMLKVFDPSHEITMSMSIWDLLLPHLTAKGKSEYAKLSKKIAAEV